MVFAPSIRVARGFHGKVSKIKLYTSMGVEILEIAKNVKFFLNLGILKNFGRVSFVFTL